jgi:transposase-like protein
MSLMEVMDTFPDNETAEAWFVASRWPDRVRCPVCDSDNVQDRPTRKPQPFRCRACRKDFSVKTGSLMHGSKLGLRTWALALYLLASGLKGTSSMKLHRDLGVTQKTAWHLAHRIRQSWQGELPRFTGVVEADEMFVGGLEGNKHSKKKLRAGRGTVGKTVVAGVRERRTGRVSAAVVASQDAGTIIPFVLERTSQDSTIYTDEAPVYRSLPNHKAVAHGAKQFVDGDVHVNGLESFWATFKRAHKGTFHHVSAKHLDRYVTEFTGRHNQREDDTIDQMAGMARGLDKKRLRYKDLIAA